MTHSQLEKTANAGDLLNSDLSRRSRLDKSEFTKSGVRSSESGDEEKRFARFNYKNQYSGFKKLWKIQTITCHYAQDKDFCFL